MGITLEQGIVFAILIGALAMFIAGRLRYDIVALLALLVISISGVIPRELVFSGFGHPAVITVAGVLVIGRGLTNAGLVDLLSQWLSRVGNNTVVQLLALLSLVAACSAFMNNVGALALLMPVAIDMARRNGKTPSLFLMPLAFGSLLGGMTTMIGTPPNIVVATFRAQVVGEPFRMFDYTPVGGMVALAGIAFIALLGWRALPSRQGQTSRQDLIRIEDYLSEVRVPADSAMVGRALRDLKNLSDSDAVIVAVLRGDQRIPAPSSYEVFQTGDILLVEAGPDSLKKLVSAAGFALVGSKGLGRNLLGSDDVGLIEAVVMTGSPIEHRTVRNLNLRYRYGVNLLAVSRQGTRLKDRLGEIRFRAGDVLLLQGRTQTLQQVMPQLGCLPLAERGLQIGQPRRIQLSLLIFGAALLLSALGFLPTQVAIVAAAVLMVLTGLISLRAAYESIDWPIIVLLGAMIPVGMALETSGGASLIAGGLVSVSKSAPPFVSLIVLLVVTMFLSDVVNNAAAAVLMCPIAVGVAQMLGTSVDPFLMCIAIGASCAFLTPIGHQSNTLVLGPGGYRFGDYWRLGLPLEIIIVVVSVPLILLIWPL